MASGLCLMETPPTQRDRAPRPAAPAPRSRLARVRSWFWRLVRIPLVLYLGMLVLLFSVQTRIIFPGSETQGRPEAEVRPGPGVELVRLTTARGDQVVALFGKALTADGQPDPQAATRPTLLYFYGNGMCLSAAADEFSRYRRLGLNVMIPEYTGYGLSAGTPSEAGCYATADAAYDHLRTRPDIDPRRIIAGGWSLGGAVALDLASRKPVSGLIVFSTFTSLVDMARRNFPYLPSSLLLRHRFDNLRKIGRVTCPILIGHGRRDDLIPFTMSERLTSAARSPVMRLAIDGAGHNDFYDVGGDRVFDAVRRFNETLAPTR